MEKVNQRLQEELVTLQGEKAKVQDKFEIEWTRDESVTLMVVRDLQKTIVELFEVYLYSVKDRLKGMLTRDHTLGDYKMSDHFWENAPEYI